MEERMKIVEERLGELAKQMRDQMEHNQRMEAMLQKSNRGNPNLENEVVGSNGGRNLNHTGVDTGQNGGQMEPGPIDPSVLTLQAKHKSSGIWEGVDDGPMTCRQHLKGKRDFVVDHAVVDFIRDSQFYGVHRLGYADLNRDLITALVERWRQETHTFHMSFGEVTVTLQDVNVLFGLRIGGKVVTGKGDYFWPQYVELNLGIRPPEDVLSGSALKLSWIKENFEHLPNNAGEDVLHRYVRAYLLYLVGSVLFPDKSGNSVQLIYLPLLADLDKYDAYSWGSATLAYLYRMLCRGCQKGKKQIGGSLILLQLWSWERISIGRPEILRSHVTAEPGVDYPLGSQIEAGSDPLGCRWMRVDRFYRDHKLGLIIYRDMFDKMTEDQFVWQPYLASVLQHLPKICHEEPEEWIVIAPMICFDIAEWHLPNRCMRQFGWHQTVPIECDTDSSIHQSDRRAMSKDYELTNRKLIELWNDRKKTKVTPGRPYMGRMDYHDPYLQWYRRITRTIISPLNKIFPVDYFLRHDYRPSGTDNATLAHGHVFNYNRLHDNMALFNMEPDDPRKSIIDDVLMMSYLCLKDSNLAHLVPPPNFQVPSPVPPQYAFRHLSRGSQLSAIQEIDTPSSSSGRPRKTRRRNGSK